MASMVHFRRSFTIYLVTRHDNNCPSSWVCVIFDGVSFLPLFCVFKIFTGLFQCTSCDILFFVGFASFLKFYGWSSHFCMFLFPSLYLSLLFFYFLGWFGNEQDWLRRSDAPALAIRHSSRLPGTILVASKRQRQHHKQNANN